MDTCLLDWNTEVEVDPSLPCQRKPLGVENELVELLWQNGEVVLQSQNHRRPTQDSSKLKQFQKQDLSTCKISENPNNSINPIQGDETVSWIHYPIDEAFDKDFCTSFFSEIPSPNPIEANKFSTQFEGNFFKFAASNANPVFPTSQQPDFASISLPPPKLSTFGPPQDHQNSQGALKTASLQLPHKGQSFSHVAPGQIPECSAMTIGSSHCGSNQVADMSRGYSHAIERNCAWKVSPQRESTEQETFEQPITSSSGGSGNSSLWKTSNLSNDNIRHKRKSGDFEESECRSDATELESGVGNKSSQKTRRSRVAEVHNMSERRRRDRINEKMKALQELIPHSNKSDKASVLDEAIEYMKSLQLQLQLMWMGRGMAPMMIPGMQHYMSRLGLGIAPPTTLPQIPNLMSLSRFPLVNHQAVTTIAPTPNPAATVGQSPVINPVNYQHQMQNSCFPEQYANYMGFHSRQTTSQPVNMFNFSSQAPQPNHLLPQPTNGNGYIR